MAVAPQTAQSARQATIRSYTDTAESYEGDWHAAFTLDDIPLGPFDERLLAWINYQLSASYTELNGAMQAYAAGQGAYNWSSMGTNIPPKGVGATGPYPAPSGYRWQYVVESSVPVTESGVRVVELQRIAA